MKELVKKQVLSCQTSKQKILIAFQLDTTGNLLGHVRYVIFIYFHSSQNICNNVVSICIHKYIPDLILLQNYSELRVIKKLWR